MIPRDSIERITGEPPDKLISDDNVQMHADRTYCVKVRLLRGNDC